MTQEGFDALWVTGSGRNNPAMVYLTGGLNISEADLFLKRGEAPILVCSAIEREEAAATGLEVRTYNQYGHRELLQQSQGDTLQANALLMQRVLEDLEIGSGKIALYGVQEMSERWGLYQKLAELLPDLTLVGEGPNSILLKARAAKEEEEVSRIRSLGQDTTEVVARVADYLQHCKIDDDELLLEKDGSPVTIGKVKAKIKVWLAERGAETPEGLIFAIGRDAAIPHNTGDPGDQLCLGKTIVFDIFPQEAGGGYFYDFTRTWCLGYAPEPEKRLFDEVFLVYQKVLADLSMDGLAAEVQENTCRYFEELGHPTIRQNSSLESGYVHSVGHGLGLSIHERPRFGSLATKTDLLSPGVVVTIEPGLYYPEKGMGCRIEDTIWMRPDGGVEKLAQYPYDLVLPMKYWQGEA